MLKSNKVTIFLAIIAIIAIIVAIFAFGRSVNSSYSNTDEYEKNIQILNDTIKELKEDIARYKAEIEKLDTQHESLKKEIELIIKSNEKIDTELANGDWDYNIQFLTEYLSKKDSLGK